MKSFLLILCSIFLFTAQQDLQEQLAKSDQLFNSFNNKAAYNLLLDIQKKYPNNAEVLWRLSRVVYHIADHMPTSTGSEKDAQLAEYQKAFSYADEAVKADPKNSMAYTYRAVANGKIALFKGVFSVSGIVNSVREDCEKAISLDPNNAIAYYVLGRTHAKLAEKPKMFRWPLGLAWGNIDDAIKFYNKAVSIDPNFVMFRLDLAKAYISQDSFQQAKVQLQAIPQLPKRDEDDDQMKAEAAKLLQEIKNK
jgi:tetratricopeptide (TPR) repeat protein